MENRAQDAGYTAKYQSSKTNFFGRRSRLTCASPTDEGRMATAATDRRTSLAGKPYFPSNGHHRHLNFLGRTSWESKDKLLVNRA